MKVRGAATAVCAVALVLAGCDGGGSDPTSSSTLAPSTTSMTSGPSTTSSPPTPSVTVSVPPAARAHTQAGAAAFASFVVVEADLSNVKADSSVIDALALDGCKGCKVIRDTAAELRRDGYHQTTQSVTVAGADLAEKPSTDVYAINVLADFKAVTSTNKAGQVSEPSKPHKNTLQVRTSWTGGSWRIQELAVLVGG